jgi:hypothetical protein
VKGKVVAPSDSVATGNDPSLDELPSRADRIRARGGLVANLIAVLVALSVVVLGLLLLRFTYRGSTVAADFTRVGGATRVETALAASRFWLRAPKVVVETPASGTSQAVIMGAARCAALHDAPLLFTSTNRARQEIVNATIMRWHPTWSPNTPGKRSGGFEPRLVMNPPEVTRCLKGEHWAMISRLSVLRVPSQQRQLRGLRPQEMLAPFVIFAAAKSPGDPPDIAVGLALAAHMARSDSQQKVSLVAVPRYLEADPRLEDKLRGQRAEVDGGVVLGLPPVMPEDTRLLLRQIITSTDKQGILAQAQASLGSVGTLIAALAVLLGLGAAAGVATKKLSPQVADIAQRVATKRAVEQPEKGAEAMAWTKTGPKSSRTAAVSYAWLDALGDDIDQEVTVWLHTGWQITGIAVRPISSRARQPVVVRLKAVRLVQRGDTAYEPKQAGGSVLLAAEDIQLITIGLIESASRSAAVPAAGQSGGVQESEQEPTD